MAGTSAFGAFNVAASLASVFLRYSSILAVQIMQLWLHLICKEERCFSKDS